MSLPESTLDRIKHVIFKVLDLPEDGIEYAEVHIGHLVHSIVIKIKTAAKEEAQDLKDLKGRILSHDRYSSDAINENSDTHEFILTPPENIKPELEQLSKIQNAQDGVMNQQDTVNKLLDAIEKKK